MMSEGAVERRRVQFDIQHPNGLAAIEVVQKLKEKGYIAYLAGGAVRDHLLDREPKDYDVATDAHPQEVLKLFPRTRKVGVAFGVVLVHLKSESVEVATFRADGEYLDGRRPSEVRFTHAAEDAKRRDFTVNGLFYDPIEGEVIDYIGGLNDLEQKELRAIGDPKQRFEEDYLRLLRSVRFSLRLGFPIESVTWQAICEQSTYIGEVARDRIHAELTMISKLSHCGDRCLQLLHQSGMYSAVFSSCTYPEELESLDFHGDEDDNLVVLTARVVLNQLRGRPLEKWLEEHRYTNQEKKEVVTLVGIYEKMDGYSRHSVAERKRLLRRYAYPELLWFLKRSTCAREDLEAVENDLKTWEEESLNPKPWLTGDDLILMGYPPGKALGKMLFWLETKTLEEGFQSAAEAKTAILEEYPLAE